MTTNQYCGPAGWDTAMPPSAGAYSAPIESPEESLVGNSLEPTDIDWFAILRPIVYDNAPNSNQRKVVARDYQDDRVVCPSHEVGITQAGTQNYLDFNPFVHDPHGLGRLQDIFKEVDAASEGAFLGQDDEEPNGEMPNLGIGVQNGSEQCLTPLENSQTVQRQKIRHRDISEARIGGQNGEKYFLPGTSDQSDLELIDPRIREVVPNIAGNDHLNRSSSSKVTESIGGGYMHFRNGHESANHARNYGDNRPLSVQLAHNVAYPNHGCISNAASSSSSIENGFVSGVASGQLAEQFGPAQEYSETSYPTPLTKDHTSPCFAGSSREQNELANAGLDDVPSLQGEYRMLIFDEASYKAKLAARLSVDAVPEDYPEDDLVAQHNIIKTLFSAVKNTFGILDSPKVALAFTDGSIPDEDIEMVCWELMLAARISQVHHLVATFHDVKYLACNSFYERLEKTIEACKKSKAICKMMLAPSYVHRVVDNPDGEFKRKKCNKTLNAKKTGQNKAGQKAIKRQKARADGSWYSDDEGGAADADEQRAVVDNDSNSQQNVAEVERPRKRARPNPRSNSSSNQS